VMGTVLAAEVFCTTCCSDMATPEALETRVPMLVLTPLLRNEMVPEGKSAVMGLAVPVAVKFTLLFTVEGLGEEGHAQEVGTALMGAVKPAGGDSV
jgi:hypothetical protein